VTECLGIHQPNALANGLGKRVQDIHGRRNPFCEAVVAILGFTECGDLLSKDGEDSLGGVTGLKAGKERMRGQVFLSFTFV
jgi:hypothetical protein